MFVSFVPRDVCAVHTDMTCSPRASHMFLHSGIVKRRAGGVAAYLGVRLRAGGARAQMLVPRTYAQPRRLHRPPATAATKAPGGPGQGRGARAACLIRLVSSLTSLKVSRFSPIC